MSSSLGTFDVLGFLQKYLTEKTGLKTSTETPKVKDPPFITIFRNGGPRDRIRYDRPIITIWVWAESESEAYNHMLKVRNAMFELQYTLEISAISESSVRITNPIDSTLKRYEAVYFLLTTI